MNIKAPEKRIFLLPLLFLLNQILLSANAAGIGGKQPQQTGSGKQQGNLLFSNKNRPGMHRDDGDPEGAIPGHSLNELLGVIFGNYHKELVPKRPTTVKMDLLLLKVKSTIEKEGIFESVVALFIEWQDDRLLWNPREYDNVSILAFDSDKVWLPDIAMTNSADHLYSISKDTRFVVRVSHDGAMKFVPTGTARTWCDLKLLTFPFDIQTCSLEFESWSLDSSTMTFNHSSDALVDDAFASPQWALCKRQAIVYDHYYNFTGETFTRVRFDFIVRRKSTFYIINLIFPCATLSLIQLLVFVIPSTDSTSDRVGFGTTNLLTLVVFQTIVTEEMPKSSDAVTALSKYIIALIIISAVGIFESVIAERMLRTTASPPPFWASKVIGIIPMLWSSQLPTGITQMILEGEFDGHSTTSSDSSDTENDGSGAESDDEAHRTRPSAPGANNKPHPNNSNGSENLVPPNTKLKLHAKRNGNGNDQNQEKEAEKEKLNNEKEKEKASILVVHRQEDNSTKSNLVAANQQDHGVIDRPKTLQLKGQIPSNGEASNSTRQTKSNNVKVNKAKKGDAEQREGDEQVTRTRRDLPSVRIFDADKREDSFIFTSLSHRIDKSLHKSAAAGDTASILTNNKSATLPTNHHYYNDAYNPNLLSIENAAYYQTIPPHPFPPVLPPPPRYNQHQRASSSTKSEELENTANNYLLMMQQRGLKSDRGRDGSATRATAHHFQSPDDLLLLGFSPGSTCGDILDRATTLTATTGDLALSPSREASSVNIKNEADNSEDVKKEATKKKLKIGAEQPEVVNHQKASRSCEDDEKRGDTSSESEQDEEDEAKKTAQRDQLLRIRNGRLWGVLVTRLDSLTFTTCTLLAIGIPFGLFVPLVLMDEKCPLLHDNG